MTFQAMGELPGQDTRAGLGNSRLLTDRTSNAKGFQTVELLRIVNEG